MDTARIVRLVSVVVAIVAGLANLPEEALILTIVGLIVGWFVEEDRRINYMLFALVLYMVQGALNPIPAVGAYLTAILGAMSTAVNAGAVTVLVMTVIDRVKPS